ncbi:MAG: electron transport complex subunit RsxD [Methyloversatilis sp. 12-65-5]|nr:MAG: electron transport complex subunit RsxD [Methyloversatilis sp. 12-65-5]
MYNSPYLRQNTSVRRVMVTVLVAMLPAIAVQVGLFGIGLLLQIVLASATALACEAAMLSLRRRPVARALGDGSALVTAWLIAVCLPPLLPWWMIVIGTSFAIIVGKHLYGGLGQNPFNPAMLAYCVLIISFPALMSQWPGLQGSDTATQLNWVLGGERALDAVTGATPLDALRTGLLGNADVSAVMQSSAFGHVAGAGWEWVALAWGAGGLLLLALRIITWHIPVAFLGAMALVSGVAWLIDPSHYASPAFHLLAGGTMLGAFFIATDPVSGATTPRGKLIFAAGIALIAWLIRAFGAYPDGIAFAVLLLNICVPLIDIKTQPPVFGHKVEPPDGGAR